MATFTQDLITAIDNMGIIDTNVIAVNNIENYAYDNKVIDEETGACYDGLNEKGLNYNQGSESIISYGIAFMEISRKVKLITEVGHWLKRDVF
ncbi:hypothetical protein [Anaerobacterium chartisolvens]|uniref:hypothetical protein n=1 Tax=Anaerobacterium chartisolvens TaxID=1297424 RepID=UPI001A9A2E3F|nr:hypothetical protein [Anaerobacterium chartisolvens]